MYPGIAVLLCRRTLRTWSECFSSPFGGGVGPGGGPGVGGGAKKREIAILVAYLASSFRRRRRRKECFLLTRDTPTTRPPFFPSSLTMQAFLFLFPGLHNRNQRVIFSLFSVSAPRAPSFPRYTHADWEIFDKKFFSPPYKKERSQTDA